MVGASAVPTRDARRHPEDAKDFALYMAGGNDARCRAARSQPLLETRSNNLSSVSRTEAANDAHLRVAQKWHKVSRCFALRMAEADDARLKDV
mmetsp:Transcript_19780/g.37739  ORF Transcript_19780/g.37739 Transcript_19780/m.37739 type:complete len:93 (+) Transcript_19780:409-687(+)